MTPSGGRAVKGVSTSLVISRILAGDSKLIKLAGKGFCVLTAFFMCTSFKNVFLVVHIISSTRSVPTFIIYSNGEHFKNKIG